MRGITSFVVVLVAIGATISCNDSNTPEPAVSVEAEQQHQQVQDSVEQQPTAKLAPSDPQLAPDMGVAQNSTAMTELGEALVQMTSERNDLAGRLTQGTALWEEHLQVLKSMTEERDSLLVPLEGVTRELDVALTELASTQTELVTINDRYQAAVADLDQATLEIQAARSNLEARMEELSVVSEQHGQVQAALDDLQTRVNEANGYVAVVTRYFEWTQLVKLRRASNYDLALALSAITAATGETKDQELIDTWDEFLNDSSWYTPELAEVTFIATLAPHLIVPGSS